MTMLTKQHEDIYKDIMSGRSIIEMLKEARREADTAFERGYNAGLCKMKKALESYNCDGCVELE